MTVQDMIEERLKADGFDGLFCRAGACGCEISDLVPCSEDCTGCEPGYKVTCSDNCDHGYQPMLDEWHIQAEKPEMQA